MGNHEMMENLSAGFRAISKMMEHDRNLLKSPFRLPQTKHDKAIAPEPRHKSRGDPGRPHVPSGRLRTRRPWRNGWFDQMGRHLQHLQHLQLIRREWSQMWRQMRQAGMRLLDDMPRRWGFRFPQMTCGRTTFACSGFKYTQAGQAGHCQVFDYQACTVLLSCLILPSYCSAAFFPVFSCLLGGRHGSKTASALA